MTNCEENGIGPMGGDGKREGRFHNTMCRVKGTVILKIWPQVLFLAIYTTVISCLHNYVDGLKMNFPLSLVTVLGTVTGLLLVFRTNTAYDRYWEGRKLWSSVNYQIRSLTLGIWLGVDDTHGKPKESENSENTSENVPTDPQTAGLVEKLSALNLLVAFVYSLKNYLRGEYSYDEDEMKDLISHLPKFQTPSSNKPLDKQGSYRRTISKHPSGDTCPISKAVGDSSESVVTSHGGSTTILFAKTETDEVESKVKESGGKKEKVKMSGRKPKRQSKKYQSLKAYDYITPSNIPLEIAYYLYSYIKMLGLKGPVETNCMRNMQASVLALMDYLTGFERILRTPMPLAYRIHLICIVWIYLLALPFQLLGTLNWWAIAAVTIASFALLGILAIGGEIENPFGYDENDLPLDDFCKDRIIFSADRINGQGKVELVNAPPNAPPWLHPPSKHCCHYNLIILIRREIQVIVSRPMPTTETWIMSKDNHPISPMSWLNAAELMGKSGEDIRELLAMGREMGGNYPFSTNL